MDVCLSKSNMENDCHVQCEYDYNKCAYTTIANVLVIVTPNFNIPLFK